MQTDDTFLLVQQRLVLQKYVLRAEQKFVPKCPHNVGKAQALFYDIPPLFFSPMTTPVL